MLSRADSSVTDIPVVTRPPSAQRVVAQDRPSSRHNPGTSSNLERVERPKSRAETQVAVAASARESATASTGTYRQKERVTMPLQSSESQHTRTISHAQDDVLAVVDAGDLSDEATIRLLKAKIRVMQVGSFARKIECRWSELA